MQHWQASGIVSAPVQVTTNFAYLPFGGGKRKCIGDQFALFESIVALAMLSRRYTFESDPNRPEVGMTTGALISRNAVQYCPLFFLLWSVRCLCAPAHDARVRNLRIKPENVCRGHHPHYRRLVDASAPS